MPDLPSASTSVSSSAGAGAAGIDYCVVMAACATHADSTPRLYANWPAILAFHGYCEGVDYAALHIEETGKPVIFIGLPIVTVGVVGRFNTAGNTGSSVVSVAAGGSGSLDEVDGVVKVVRGGTIGTSQIALELSLDGGRTFKPLRLGTASSYVIPHIGQTLSFAAGTLVAGDTVLTWHSTAPRWDQAGLQAARTALAAQMKGARTWMVIGDLTVAQDATDVLTEANAYDTTTDRFVVARAALKDRLPYATLSHVTARMTGNPNLTFLEVGGTGDTITRSAGSWITDGFAVGDIITVAGSASNNFVGASKITGVTATVLTLGSDDLVNEGPVGNVTVTGCPSLVFAEVGASADTITRNRGSWLDDGFRVGDLINVTGSASNNITGASAVASVTATVLTLGTDDLADETIGSSLVTITAGQTKAAHVAALETLFAAIDAQPRISLGHGRLRKESLILDGKLRRSVQWMASIRQYQHDVHVATWEKDLGPCDGWDLNDVDGNLVEHDERYDGGALPARFTCARTWANGPLGAFIAMDLTRAAEGNALQFMHNAAVTNLAQTIVQAATEKLIGKTPVVDGDGFAIADERSTYETLVNSELARSLFRDKGEGPPASSAVWTMDTDDDLRPVDATLNGDLALNLRGTVVNVATSIRVNGAA